MCKIFIKIYEQASVYTNWGPTVTDEGMEATRKRPKEKGSHRSVKVKAWGVWNPSESMFYEEIIDKSKVQVAWR